MTRWNVDKAHSEVQFKVKHLMINTVTGSFNDYDVQVESTGTDFTAAKVLFTANVASLTTGNEMRDNHLRSDDFFNAEAFPAMVFESTSMTPTSGDNFKLEGTLTIRDITKPVSLDVIYGGSMVDFYGNHKAGFEATAKINRKEFGLAWNGITEAGGVVVSDEVRILLNVQLQQIVTETSATQTSEVV